jgi:hypothetical protein
MTSKIYNQHQENENRNKAIVYEVVRPQRKKLSRYKLKKQVGIIEQIMGDPQIVNM